MDERSLVWVAPQSWRKSMMAALEHAEVETAFQSQPPEKAMATITCTATTWSTATRWKVKSTWPKETFSVYVFTKSRVPSDGSRLVSAHVACFASWSRSAS